MRINKKILIKILAVVVALSIFVAVPVYSQFFIISNDFPTDKQMDYIKKGVADCKGLSHRKVQL